MALSRLTVLSPKFDLQTWSLVQCFGYWGYMNICTRLLAQDESKSKQSCRHIHLGSPTAKRNSYDVKFTTVTHAQSIFKTLAVTSIGSLDNSTPENSIPSKTVSQSSRTGSPSSGRLCLSLRTEHIVCSTLLHCSTKSNRLSDCLRDTSKR